MPRLPLAACLAACLAVPAAAADWPVEAAAVMVALPDATAVTRHAEPDTAAVATAVLLEVQLASVGAEVVEPPEICTAKFSDSPMFMLADGGEMVRTTGAAGATGTVTSSPQAPSAARAPRLRATSALFRLKSDMHPPLARFWSDRAGRGSGARLSGILRECRASPLGEEPSA